MFKCTGKGCTTELTECAKFCPDCGTAAPAIMAKAVCGACSHEQSGDSKFCAQCGTAIVAVTGVQYDDAIGAVEQWAKSNTGKPVTQLAADDEDGDEDEDDLDLSGGGDGDEDEDDEGLEAGESTVDALPLVKALVLGNRKILKSAKGSAAQYAAILKGQEVLAKALVTILSGQKSVALELAALKEGATVEPLGSRKPRQLRADVLSKAVGGSKPPVVEDGDMSGVDVMAKAVMASQRGLLTPQQVAMMGTYCGESNLTLKQAKQHDPSLFGAFEQVAASMAAAAH